MCEWYCTAEGSSTNLECLHCGTRYCAVCLYSEKGKMASMIKCASCGKKPRTKTNSERGKWVTDNKTEGLKVYQSVRCAANGCNNRTWTRGYCSEHLKDLNDQSMKKIFIESLRPSNNNPEVHDETTPPPKPKCRPGSGRRMFSSKIHSAKDSDKPSPRANVARRRSFQIDVEQGERSVDWNDLHPKKSPKETVYDRLTSVKTFTGSHKHRFDEEGKGLGLSGRDSIPKGRGFLPDKYQMYDVV
eukprot:Nk52_evm33s221 gene=Nk52_evmTU33s221